MRYRFHYQNYRKSTVKPSLFLKFNQKIIQSISRAIDYPFNFFRIKKNYRKTETNTLDFSKFYKSTKNTYKYDSRFSENASIPVFKKKIRNRSIYFKSIKKKFFNFISNFSIPFISAKNLLNSIFSLKKKSIISNGDRLNKSAQSVIQNNQKPSSPVFLYYFIFFLLLGLLPFFYLGTENDQSMFLSWVQAQDISSEKEYFSSDLALSGVDKQENSLPQVILLNDKYNLETENYPKFYAGFNGVVNSLMGNNDNVNIENGNSGGGGPANPSINYLAVSDGKKKEIINYESTNETISEDSIGDWVDENEQNIFEKKFSNPYLTVKKEDKIRKAFEHQTYKVMAGDSLWSISKKFNISIDSIISLNQIKKLPNLAKGRQLLIPKLSGVYYKVKKDDSLFKIAKRYGVTIEQVKEYNDLGGYLQIGKRLFLPGGKYSRFQKDYIFGNLFISPVDGVLSSRYGFRHHPIKGKRLFHTGVDIAKNQGDKIRSVADGVVVQAGFNGGYGKYILLRHSMGYKTAYAHLSVIWVKPGQKVKKGQFIGKVGNTGLSTGPHLHFEVKHNNKFINPLRFVKY